MTPEIPDPSHPNPFEDTQNYEGVSWSPRRDQVDIHVADVVRVASRFGELQYLRAKGGPWWRYDAASNVFAGDIVHFKVQRAYRGPIESLYVGEGWAPFCVMGRQDSGRAVDFFGRVTRSAVGWAIIPGKTVLFENVYGQLHPKALVQRHAALVRVEGVAVDAYGVRVWGPRVKRPSEAEGGEDMAVRLLPARPGSAWPSVRKGEILVVADGWGQAVVVHPATVVLLTPERPADPGLRERVATWFHEELELLRREGANPTAPPRFEEPSRGERIAEPDPRPNAVPSWAFLEEALRVPIRLYAVEKMWRRLHPTARFSWDIAHGDVRAYLELGSFRTSVPLNRPDDVDGFFRILRARGDVDGTASCGTTARGFSGGEAAKEASPACSRMRGRSTSRCAASRRTRRGTRRSASPSATGTGGITARSASTTGGGTRTERPSGGERG